MKPRCCCLVLQWYPHSLSRKFCFPQLSLLYLYLCKVKLSLLGHQFEKLKVKCSVNFVIMNTYLSVSAAVLVFCIFDIKLVIINAHQSLQKVWTHFHPQGSLTLLPQHKKTMSVYLSTMVLPQVANTISTKTEVSCQTSNYLKYKQGIKSSAFSIVITDQAFNNAKNRR